MLAFLTARHFDHQLVFTLSLTHPFPDLCVFSSQKVLWPNDHLLSGIAVQDFPLLSLCIHHELSLSRSLRLFFSDERKSCGQMIIASQESQYKIFHFHHGGLDKLIETFHEWNLFAAAASEAGNAVNELRWAMSVDQR